MISATRLALALCALVVWHSALAEQLIGKVVAVQDGNSITLELPGKLVKVRLSAIDAPELKQRFGIESRDSLREMCLSKEASVQTRGTEKYRRTLGWVRCAGVDANIEQVRRGMAWVYYRYARKDSPVRPAEREARENRRGLWVDDHPRRPWEWRDENKAKEVE